MLKHLCVMGVCIAALAACGSTRSPAIPDRQVQTSLALVEPSSRNDESWKTLFPHSAGNRPPGLDMAKEGFVAQACGVDVPEAVPETLPAVLVGLVLDQAISFVLDRVEKEIARVIEEHSAAYVAAATKVDFYRDDVTVRTNYTCFRFTRGTPNAAPEMEVIGQIALAPDAGALLVRPLRVYFGEPAARRGTEFGVSVGIKANATWRDNGVGAQSDAFDVPFFSFRIDTEEANAERVMYPVPVNSASDGFVAMPEKAVMVSIPSWSTPRTASPFGNVVTTVSVAEVGVPPKFLKEMQSLFSENKDKIKDVLKDAANKVLPQP